MKKVSILIAICFLQSNLFGQSITLDPTASGEIQIKKYSNFPRLDGFSSSGSAAAPSATTNGTTLLQIRGLGHNGTSFNTNSSSRIDFLATENFSSTAAGGAIRFSTAANGNTSAADRMIISNLGNLGIGLSNPISKLHIADGSSGITPASSVNLFLESTGANYLGIAAPDAFEKGLFFSHTSGGSNDGGIIYTPSRDMIFRTTDNIKMTLGANGYLGLGDTAPSDHLSIVESAASTSARISMKSIHAGSSTNFYHSSTGQTLFYNLSGTGMQFYSPDRISINGSKVGIGNNLVPDAQLTVTGDFQLNKITSFPVNGGYADLNRQNSSIIKFN
ncbi:MAG: hypothetical protein ACRCVT_00710, partial [Leadbetterella sp.]